MKPNVVKGLVHLGLAMVAVGELFTATSRTRKVLLGSMAGFHAHATLYHFIYEKETNLTQKRNTMKRIMIIALFLILAMPVFGQTYGGVPAPDAIHLKITQVSNIATPEHPFTGNISALQNVSSKACSLAGAAPCEVADQVTESSTTYKVTATDAAVKYELSCIDSTVSYPMSYGGRATRRYYFTIFSHSSANWQPRCEQFHVGDTVTFYSLNTLIWLEITNKGHDYTHPDCWKFDHYAGMSCEYKSGLPEGEIIIMYKYPTS